MPHCRLTFSKLQTHIKSEARFKHPNISINYRYFFTIICLFGMIKVLAACSVNPATGHSDFIVVSKAREKSIGQIEHPKIIKEFGGVYGEGEVSEYVATIGGKLTKATETPDISFTFTVLDSPIVNAFTTPGGYVYVTRGLVALADTESQLASVIGHELGHAVARHSAQRLSQATLANFGLTILDQIVETAALNIVAERLTNLYLKAYSRENEYEADLLGVRYISRAGYDPNAAYEFLRKLDNHTRLKAKLTGRPIQSLDKFDITATHPRNAERTKRVASAADKSAVVKPYIGRAKHLSSIDNMIYGSSAKHGFIIDRRFAHRELQFEFTVPIGFALSDQQRYVEAHSEVAQATIIFDRAPKLFSGNMSTYVNKIWVPDTNIENLEAVIINGMEGATGSKLQQINKRKTLVRLVAIRYAPNIIYRFTFLTPPSPSSSLIESLKRTTYSFRKLNKSEASSLPEKRIRIVQVKPGDTIDALAKKMDFSRYNRERFKVLNGLSGGTPIIVGSFVKLVTR